jgi:hypothetical protein
MPAVEGLQKGQGQQRTIGRQLGNDVKGAPLVIRNGWAPYSFAPWLVSVVHHCAHRDILNTFLKKLYTPALNLQSISEFPRRYINPVSEFSNTLNIAMSIILISPYSHH